MIVFLTLIYVAILVLLIKLKVIRLTLWWKISPVVWMLLLFIVLFIPMQWGAPAGNVTQYQSVVEIVPNVSGTIIDVPIQGNRPLKKGDVLFKIDPRPFQYRVEQIKAAMAEAKQAVPQLEAAWINQINIRHVKPGQPAEVVLQLYPGKTLKATVDSIVLMSGTGQLKPRGEVPEQPAGQQPPGQYGVILKISDAAELPLGVPGGAIGTAAIYTESAKATQIIRKVMVRMQAWKNYIIPG